MATSFSSLRIPDANGLSPVEEGIGLRHRRSPLDAGSWLHVEEQRRSTAPLRHLALPLLGDLLATVEAVAVVALLEARERVVDLVERLRLHLHQGELDVLLDVGFG